MKLQRITIYPRDVMNITGKSYTTSCRLLQAIRKAENKTKKQFVTIDDFCRYHTEFSRTMVEKHLI